MSCKLNHGFFNTVQFNQQVFNISEVHVKVSHFNCPYSFLLYCIYNAASQLIIMFN